MESSSAGTATIDAAAWRERIRQETFSNYHFEMGRSLRQLGDTEQAVKALRRAIQEEPDHVLAHGLLVDCLRNTRHPEAEESHRAALSLDPRYAVAVAAVDLADQANRLIQRQDTNGALALLDRARALDPVGAARAIVTDTLLQLSHALSQSDPASALSVLEKAAAMDPDDFWVLAQLGSAYDVAERWDEAIRCFEAGLKIVPTHETLLSRLLASLNMACRFEDTVSAARHGAAQSTGSALSLYLAVALIGLDRNSEAVKVLQGVSSPNVAAMATLGLAHLAAGELDQAEGVLTRSMQTDAGNPVLLGWLGLVRQRQGDFDKALALHARAIEAAPTLAMSRLDRALTLDAMNRHEEALEEHRHVLVHAGRRVEYWIRSRPWASSATLPIYQGLGLTLMR